jgi:formate hydrogenlyase subunit 3/multisubunit Na+/H+ antiporter MnhD subunit
MAPLVAALVVPLVLVLAAALVPAARPGRVLTGGAVASALVAPAVVATGALPARSAVLLVFITGLVVVVAAFSRRHLDGDVRRPRYDRLMLLTAAGAVLAVTTPDLLLLAVGWVATGWGLTGLVGHHQGLAGTEVAVRSLRRARLVGDAALVGALALLVVGAGSTGVETVAAWAGSAPVPLLGVAALGLAVAAAARSGLVPFSRWLPLSVVAPAPVSALLHAGVANAPVVLLVALAPVWTASPVLAWGLLGYAVASAVATFPRLLVRADVKTRLAWSTTAQLAFMVALVAAGAYVAALLHMMLHGVYKATAFLWAGAELPRNRLDRLPTTPRGVRVAGALLGVALVAGVLAVDQGWRHPLSGAVLLVAGTAGGYGIFSLAAAAGTRVAAVVVALASVGAVLVAAAGLGAVLDVPLTADGPRAWAAAAAVVALAATGVWLRTRRTPLAWAWLHRAADPVAVPRRRRPVAPRGPAQPHVDAASVRAAVGRAAAAVPPSWGWQTFIASNPLLGEEHRSFEDAVRTAAGRGWTAVAGVEPAARAAQVGAASQRPQPVDDVLAGWLAAWTNTAPVPFPAPGRELPLWSWVRVVGALDPVLGRGCSRAVRALPDDAAEVLSGLVCVLGVQDVEEWAREELLRLPGWAGYLGRRGTVGAALDAAPLVDLLAARALLSLLVGEARDAAPRPAGALPAPPQEAAPPPDPVRAAMAALEARERELTLPVLGALDGRDPSSAVGPGAGSRAAADLVFCIDVRSEVLRRHLEATGPYRTVGFAGFFGMPVRRECAGSTPTDRLPILLAPNATVREAPPARAGLTDVLHAGLRQALDTPGSGFAAVDVAGLRGLLGSVRVLAPSTGRLPAPVVRPLGLDLAGQPQLVDAAVGLVRAAGLHGPGTGRLVVLVGHGSTSTNNPAEAAFDCGACGGSRGAFNARVAAAVLATDEGRAALAAAGVPLPADTVVVAAEHDTALDRVRVLDPGAVPASHRDDLARLEGDLALAGAATAAERARLLPGAGSAGDAVRAVRTRALDPGEVRHEWGLAGNAFFVAAPRSLTRDLDLAGRSFLHDYEPSADPSGALLELILTAPVVVAHWINMQYVLSTADPERLGSGSKTAHNPVGGIGVLAGAGGDLRTGLAEQSVRHLGRPVLDPTRLCVVVHAARADVDAVLEAHPDVLALVTGGWLTLHVHEPGSGAVLRRFASGWLPLGEEPEAEEARDRDLVALAP